MSDTAHAQGGIFAATHAGDAAPRPLPRGRHGLSRDVVLLAQRSRLLDGMVHAVAERGYGAATVADALRHAGVSRATFYEHFADKEDCFCAAYAAGARVHHKLVMEAVAAASDPHQRLRAGTAAYLDVLEEQPDYARAFLIEVAAAGPRAAELRAEALRRYVEMLQQWYAREREDNPRLHPLPESVFVAYVVGSNGLVTGRLRRSQPRLHELLPVLMYLQLSLFGMHDEAVAALEDTP
jgi:AcrR family transcriptional regulator